MGTPHRRKRHTQIEEPNGRPLWTVEELNAIADRGVHLDDRDKWAVWEELETEFNRGNQRKGRPGHTIQTQIWKLANRMYEFVSVPDYELQSGPATDVEKWIIRTAFESDSEEAKAKRVAPPDAAYLAPLLRRTLKETEHLIFHYGPAQGRGGFGLRIAQ